MASKSFGSKKRPAGRKFREDILGEALDDVYRDVEAGFVAMELYTPAILSVAHAHLDGGDTITITAPFDLTVLDFTVIKTEALSGNNGVSTLTVKNTDDGVIGAVSIQNIADTAVVRMSTWSDVAAVGNIASGAAIKLVFAKAHADDDNACIVRLTVIRR